MDAKSNCTFFLLSFITSQPTTTARLLGLLYRIDIDLWSRRGSKMSMRDRSGDCYGQPVVQFQCTIKNLQDLMQTRGMEAHVKLQQEFGGVVELCRRLYTSPTEGCCFRAITRWHSSTTSCSFMRFCFEPAFYYHLTKLTLFAYIP